MGENKTKSIGKLAVSDLETYIQSKNQYAEIVGDLGESKDSNQLDKRFKGDVYHWNSLPGKTTDLTVLVDLSFYYKKEPAHDTYDIEVLRVFIRPKPKQFQFRFKAKQKIDPDYIDFDKTMKNQEKFVFALCQKYKENDILFTNPVFESKEGRPRPGVLIKESNENEAPEKLELSISCCQYFLDCRENKRLTKPFSRDELANLIDKLLDDYVSEFNKLKKSDFNFKR